MRVKDSNLAHLIKDVHVSNNGIYYFFDSYIIAEINEGVTYTWDSAQDIIKAAYEFYGKESSICYITNRVNKYAVNPSDWLKFFKNEHDLNGYAIVSKSEIGWANSIIERMFLSTKVDRFTDLYDAVNWAKQKNEEAKKINVSLKESVKL